MRNILPLLIVVTTTACAGQTALRSTSAQTAAVLDQYRSAFRTFASSQTDLNNQIEARIGQLQSMQAQREGEVEVRTLAWTLADDKAAQQQYALLTKMKADAFLGPGAILGPAVPSTDPAPPKLTFDTAAVDGVIKQLVELQKPRTNQDLVADLLAFGTATYKKAVEEAATAAEGEAKATKAEGDDTKKADEAAASVTDGN